MYVCLRSSNLSQLSQRPRLITEVSYNFPFPLKYSYTYIFPFVSVLAKGIYHCTCIWVYFKIFTYVCMWKYTLYNFIRIPFEFCFFKIYQFFKQTIPFSSSLIIDSFFITNCCTYHVSVYLICDVLRTQLYNHHTYDVSQRLNVLIILENFCLGNRETARKMGS